MFCGRSHSSLKVLELNGDKLGSAISDQLSGWPPPCKHVLHLRGGIRSSDGAESVNLDIS